MEDLNYNLIESVVFQITDRICKTEKITQNLNETYLIGRKKCCLLVIVSL